MMKVRHILEIILLLFMAMISTSVLSGCGGGPGFGDLVFYVTLENYSTGTGAEVFLENSETGRTYSEFIDFDGSDSGFSTFSALEAGEWTVSVALEEGDTLLGEGIFTVQAVSDVSTVSRIDSRFADGDFFFSIVSSSAQNTPSIRTDKFDAFITAGQRSSSPEVDFGTRVHAFGSFDSALGADCTFPDGFSFEGSPKNLIDHVFMSIRNDSIEVYRPDYYEEGEHTLRIQGAGGTEITEIDSVGFISGPEFKPEIQNPAHDELIPTGVGYTVDWLYGNAPEVEAVAMVVYEEDNPGTLVYRDISTSPQTTNSFFIPGATFSVGLYYRIIVFTLNTPIDYATIDSFERYDFDNLPYQAAKHMSERMTGFTYHERRIRGN